MLLATHPAGSVVTKATVTTARGATMQIAVRGLFYAICGERIEGDKKKTREIRFHGEINMHFIFNLREKMGRN
jgi:hypothetical protein